MQLFSVHQIVPMHAVLIKKRSHHFLSGFLNCLCRGVGMAIKMPSRSLKKECAAILESMKVRN